MASFAAWCNERHLHSGIGYVTPADRHAGQHVELLEQRQAVYAPARRRHPERWSRGCTTWERAEVVNEPLLQAA